MSESRSSQDPYPEPDPRAIERVKREREALDPTIDPKIREEALDWIRRDNSRIQAAQREDFTKVSDEDLAQILSDESTPIEDVEEIYTILLERGGGKILPPTNE